VPLYRASTILQVFGMVGSVTVRRSWAESAAAAEPRVTMKRATHTRRLRESTIKILENREAF
jgi:hypothetical protein